MPELFHVVTPKEALSRLHSHLSQGIGTEQVKVYDALDRVVARDIFAPADLPAFPRANMDGYAVRAADTYGASESLPAYIKVTGEIRMGSSAELSVSPGEAVRIHTGGMLAPGADAVVMIENTQEIDATTIEVVRPVAPGENVLQVGDDVCQGKLLVPSGQRLRPQEIGGLVALGITEVLVYRRPKVAILSTGDEVVPPEATPDPGQVRDINTYTLSALARQAGGEPIPLGIVKDDFQKLLDAAQAGLEKGDILLISAGSSVSTRDITAQVISSLGKPGILAHGISIRPGKPTVVAVVQGKAVLGLPGNPVSAMVVFDLLVTPTIHRLTGCINPPLPLTAQAQLTRNIPSTTGREDYVQVRLEKRDGQLWATPIFGEANLITVMMRADGVGKVPLDKHGLSAGEMITVRLF